MKSNTLLLLAFLCLTTICLNAQINYKTESLDHNLSPIKLSVSILNFENVITPITAGIVAEGHLKDKIFYNAQFRQGYIRNFTVTKENLLTSQKESKGTYFEAGLDLVLADKTD